MHLLTDGAGVPLAVDVSAGQVNECSRFENVMQAAGVSRRQRSGAWRPKSLAGDMGYSSRRIRSWLRRRRIRPVIPLPSCQHPARPEPLDRALYRRRNAIERCVGWLKELRRIATRFEKLAVNYLAMLKLAIVARYLRIAFPDRA